MFQSIICLLAIVASVQCIGQTRHILGEYEGARHFQVSGRSPRHESVTFSVALRQRNLDTLHSLVAAVTDPKSPKYRQYLTTQEINELTGPGAAVFHSMFERSTPVFTAVLLNQAHSRVVQWLLDHHVDLDHIIVLGDTIKVKCPVFIAEKLLKTEFHDHLSKDSSGKQFKATIGAFSIPTSLSRDIEHIYGVSELFNMAQIGRKMDPPAVEMTTLLHQIQSAAYYPTFDLPGEAGYNLTLDTGAKILLTPSKIRQLYGVPPSALVTNSSITQSVASFSNLYSAEALEEFNHLTGIDNQIVHIEGGNLDATGGGQIESDLDVQYMCAMGRNATTWFWIQDEGYWILQWAEQVVQHPNPPLVHSLSYGLAEDAQCFAAKNCERPGLSVSSAYVQRTNVELAKIALRGISVLVSSGDDGAPALFFNSGNFPIDPNRFCPSHDCQRAYPGGQPTQWPSNCSITGFTITTDNPTLNANGPCYYGPGTQSANCVDLGQVYGTGLVDMLVDYVSLYPCIELWMDGTLNLQICGEGCNGTVSPKDFLQDDGYTVTLSPYQYDPSGPSAFVAMFPTSSPYVTSVGATQLSAEPNPFCTLRVPVTADGQSRFIDCEPGEVVSSILTGSGITGGGGFSHHLDRPSYQRNAVQKWINYATKKGNIPPEETFDITKRGYPDISALGHNYIVVSGTGVNGSCPCKARPVDGTSASAPLLAGMVSLLNDELARRGQPALGFLNPLLYTMASERPEAFNDIVSGDIGCNREVCAAFAYHAAPGWDPASGLGSPVYPEILRYILEEFEPHIETSNITNQYSNAASEDKQLLALWILIAVFFALFAISVISFVLFASKLTGRLNLRSQFVVNPTLDSQVSAAEYHELRE